MIRNKDKDKICCNWPDLRFYLTHHWNNLSSTELDKAGPNRRKLASLFGKKYRIRSKMAENYLKNIERMMPLPNQ